MPEIASLASASAALLEQPRQRIGEYIDRHNDNPKPFVWTAKATDILEKVKRAREALDIA